MYVSIKTLLYKFNGVDWGSGSDIDYAMNISFKQSLGDSSDTFSFKVYNINNTRVSTFSVQDKVEFHLLINGETSSSDTLVFSGLVKGITENYDTKGKILTIEGVSFGDITTQGIVFKDLTNVNVMEFLKGCLESMPSVNSSFTLSWDNDNPTVKSTGGAFPKLNGGGLVKEYYKTLNKVINDYLKPANTGDGLYYWFVTKDNKLSIRKRTISSGSTFTEGSNMSIVKYGIDSKDVKNFVIIKCGFSPKGGSITARSQDPISMNKYGVRAYYIVDTNIAANIINSEVAANRSLFQTDKPFPLSGSYPYTITTWFNSDGSSIEVANDDEWNSAVKAEAKRIGRTRGDEYLQRKTYGSREIDILIDPSRSYNPGDVVIINSDSFGLSNFPMRVQEVGYSSSNVTLNLIEDEGSV